MGIVTGYVSLFLLLWLLIRFVAWKLHWNKVNRVLSKSHKVVGFMFIIISLVHFALVLKVLEGRHILVTVSGVVMLAAGILMTVLHYIIKDRRLGRKIHLVFSTVMAVMLVVHIAVYVVDFSNYLQAVKAIQLEGIDLNTVEDGTYVGEYDAGYVYAKVRVTVDHHTITNIDLIKHITERGKPAEVITDTMVQKQSIEVDAVSGATNSSRVIMKACENAIAKK